MRLHGFAAFVPHRNMLDELLGWGETHYRWLAEDLAFVEVCDGVLRLPGISPGADEECAAARALGIPVFDDMADLLLGMGGLE